MFDVFLAFALVIVGPWTLAAGLDLIGYLRGVPDYPEWCVAAPCQLCGTSAPLRCGPSRFGDETWACIDCWEPSETAAHSSAEGNTP